jgi:hypothetical protein
MGSENKINMYFLLRVSENRVPRRIFGPKREDVTGARRQVRGAS